MEVLLMKLQSVISKISVGIGLSMAMTFSHAAFECKDVKYGNDDYHENMEILAIEAGLTGSYFTRYHEAVVSELCGYSENDDGYIEQMIDTDYVTRSEIEGIKEVLGLDDSSYAGRNYEHARHRLNAMGLSSAGASNSASFYAYEPNSTCGKMAKAALEGNQKAVSVLQNEPAYCH